MKRSLAHLTVMGLVLLVFATDPAWSADEPAADRLGDGQWSLTGAQRTRLDRALKPLHAQYDPEAQMLREPFHSPGYHTTLKGGFVHGTRPSLGNVGGGTVRATNHADLEARPGLRGAGAAPRLHAVSVH